MSVQFKKHQKSIETVDDIARLLQSGFSDWKSLGDVSIKEQGDLTLFNYTPMAQINARWNKFELVSRGLIINRHTGEIVARPFDKFFNWNEGGRQTSAAVRSITEKMDGSFGILYRESGGFRVATRGSFSSEQAVWATEFLNKNYDLSDLSLSYTLLFEIIYPDNRIVVDYGSRQDLVLIGIRNRFTGEILPVDLVDRTANQFGFNRPTVYQMSNVDDILSLLPKLTKDKEGFVVVFEDDSLFKFKGNEYLTVHKLVSNLSFSNTLKAVQKGKLDEMKQAIPDEFIGEVDGWLSEINSVVDELFEEIVHVFQLAPKQSRKEFAQWTMQNHKDLSHYLFAMLDDKDIKPMILRYAF